MAKCELTGKSRMNGHKVSHSNIKTKKVTKANIQTKRIFDVETGRWVKMKISTRALRTLNKKSLSAMLRD
ncbi:MAG: 50S ribosomal protein L28 [Myxococcales bacterium]|nr:50S ribosomal protein L28 [Myxococcales bacterium]|tara:strand:- start:69 stop:278 length:210 start_codon:yes stop_codon:yes gene_type:complete